MGAVVLQGHELWNVAQLLFYYFFPLRVPVSKWLISFPKFFLKESLASAVPDESSNQADVTFTQALILDILREWNSVKTLLPNKFKIIKNI